MLDFFCELDQKEKIDGMFDYGVSYLEHYFCYSKCIRTTLMMLLEQYRLNLANVRTTVTWLEEDQRRVFSVTWLDNSLLLRKILSTHCFQLCRRLKHYLSHCCIFWGCRWKQVTSSELSVRGKFRDTFPSSKNIQTQRTISLVNKIFSYNLCRTVEVWLTGGSETFFLKM